MKKELRGFVAGLVTATLIFGLTATALAASGNKSIQVAYDNIKIYINEKLTPMVTDGLTVEPFTYQGRTYVPLNAVATALGQQVGWDDATKSIYIGSQPASAGKTTPTTPGSSTATTGQKNALKKANSYLDFMAFSYSGLIEQLEFDGFSSDEATYAADNCGANWKEQAAKKAKSYLEIMSFSRSGLIEQLKFDGFTSDQAEYGTTAAGY